MDEKVLETLKQAGVDVDGALERFMGNTGLLKKFLLKFLDDKDYGILVKAIEDGDTDTAFKAAHTLKGVCGNLSLMGMFRLIGEQTELLRAGNLSDAAAMMPEVTAEYNKMVDVIKTNLA